MKKLGHTLRNRARDKALSDIGDRVILAARFGVWTWTSGSMGPIRTAGLLVTRQAKNEENWS